MESCLPAELHSTLPQVPKIAGSSQGAFRRSTRHPLLARAIEALPPSQRLVLSLLYFEELSLSETAAVTEQTELHVQRLHDQALSSLQSSA